LWKRRPDLGRSGLFSFSKWTSFVYVVFENPYAQEHSPTRAISFVSPADIFSKERTMSWFPLCKALMEDNPEFSLMPSRYKVLFWMLISEYNLRGVFYRCDLEMAVMLNTTPKTIQRARKLLVGCGLLTFRP